MQPRSGTSRKVSVRVEHVLHAQACFTCKGELTWFGAVSAGVGRKTAHYCSHYFMLFINLHPIFYKAIARLIAVNIEKDDFQYPTTLWWSALLLKGLLSDGPVLDPDVEGLLLGAGLLLEA